MTFHNFLYFKYFVLELLFFIKLFKQFKHIFFFCLTMNGTFFNKSLFQYEKYLYDKSPSGLISDYLSVTRLTLAE